MILILAISLTSTATNCIEIKCGTHFITYPNVEGYITTCFVEDLTTSSLNDEITSFDGLYPQTDYVGLLIQHQTMPYWPQKLGDFFTSVERLQVSNSQLKAVSKSDLEKFTEMTNLHLDGNDLKVLKGGLFEFNPKLQHVNFLGNNFVQIDANLFNGLNDLEEVKFGGGGCVNFNAKNKEEVAELIEIIEVNCTESIENEALSSNI